MTYQPAGPRTLSALPKWRRIGTIIAMAEAMAVLFAAWALVLGTIAGPQAVRQRYNTSIWVIMASYLLSAPFAGFIVGVLFPINETTTGRSIRRSRCGCSSLYWSPRGV